ncbi:zinc-ribbon and DUF3426 domain-containing protein [Solemya elarraichensis gill symbiont]|uniref:zinc-ribbon and DUF3426 domain-containing protein n=1 Tax=Solemya elarraichensis gill symbiont TaxID=1918949 RepID=UPI0010834AEC|nr:zinc-ribbon and DUF3426 domain-containing protein [Solemya elarraichensis gill symbiont]
MKGAIQCPHCGATYRMTAALAAKIGQDAHCAMCQGIFTIPGAAAKASESSPEETRETAPETPHTIDGGHTKPEPEPEPEPAPEPKPEPKDERIPKPRPAPARKAGAAPLARDKGASDSVTAEQQPDLDHLTPRVRKDKHSATESGTGRGYSTAIRGLRPDRKPRKAERQPAAIHSPREVPVDAPEVRIETAQEETRSRPGWQITVGLLVLVLCLQLAWSFRDNPAVYKTMASVSETFGMTPPMIRSPQELELTNRLFTRVENSDNLFDLHLTVANRAIWPQPYPTIELTLTDKYGISRVRQRINPEAYLQNGGQGVIGAGEEVEISFLVESSSSDVVGFLLEFL